MLCIVHLLYYVNKHQEKKNHKWHWINKNYIKGKEVKICQCDNELIDCS